MYVVGFVIPVPKNLKPAYFAWASQAHALLSEYGCLEVIDAWEDNVPQGELTDFRKAVQAKPDEAIAVSWQKWPDRAHVDAVERAMGEDARFDPPGEIPFSQRRLIMGGFEALVD